MLTGNPQQASDIRLSPAGRRNDPSRSSAPGWGRAALGIADRWIGRHRSLPSVILFEIDVECIAVLEFESDAPGPIDMDGVSLRLKSSQRRRRLPPTSPHTNIPP